jgi:hypothetical protein
LTMLAQVGDPYMQHLQAAVAEDEVGEVHDDEVEAEPVQPVPESQVPASQDGYEVVRSPAGSTHTSTSGEGGPPSASDTESEELPLEELQARMRQIGSNQSTSSTSSNMVASQLMIMSQLSEYPIVDQSPPVLPAAGATAEPLTGVSTSDPVEGVNDPSHPAYVEREIEGLVAIGLDTLAEEAMTAEERQDEERDLAAAIAMSLEPPNPLPETEPPQDHPSAATQPPDTKRSD